MYTFLLIIHILIVVALLAVILIQRGRSGGLIEALGGVESLFGTKTSSFFVKTTVVLAILFFASTITLAWLAKGRGKSLMDTYKTTVEADVPMEKTTPLQNAAAPAAETPAEQKTEAQMPAAGAESIPAAGTHAQP
jgi:preprotein translocase subunit SecG